MALIYALNNIINGRDYCCLCLKPIGNGATRIQDEIAIKGTMGTEQMFEILSFLLNDEDLNSISQLDSICSSCTKLSINSYTFVKMCKENCKNLYKAIESLEDCLQNSVIVDCKSVFVSLNYEDLTKCSFYDHKRPVNSREAALKRFQCITNKKKHKHSKKSKCEPVLCTSPIRDSDGENTNSINKTQLKKEIKSTIPIYHNTSIDTSGNIIIKCKKCSKVYPNVPSLKRHYIRVHAPKEFKCKKCPRRYGSEPLLQQHKLESHTPAICSQCGKSYRNRHSLKIHELGHKPKVMCQSCGRSYKNRITYKKHIQSKMCLQKEKKSNVEAKFTCDYCNKKFCNKPTLRVHIQFEHGNGKAYVCMWCSKKFNAPSRLKAHIVKHTQEKKFCCEFCGGKFVTKESLLYHTRIHTGERPYECHFCDKRFLSTSRRAEHIRRQHMTATLECEICSSKFKKRSCLTRHKRRHFNPKSRLHCSQKGFEDDGD